MWLTQRFLIQHLARTEDAEDSWGTKHSVWDDPVEVEVFGWAPPSPDTEIRDIGSGVRRDLDLYTPTGFARPGDRVVIEGETYEVIGSPEDFTHGPFGFPAGYRINLQQTEG
jgi:hypothetical protein|nr:MAG TPA: Minor capsid protein [Caudoviricetes sp.]